MFDLFCVILFFSSLLITVIIINELWDETDRIDHIVLFIFLGTAFILGIFLPLFYGCSFLEAFIHCGFPMLYVAAMVWIVEVHLS